MVSESTEMEKNDRFIIKRYSSLLAFYMCSYVHGLAHTYTHKLQSAKLQRNGEKRGNKDMLLCG